MFFGVPGLKKIAAGTVLLITASLALLSCGGSSSPNTHHTSGLKFRAFVFNTLSPGALGPAPVLNIIDATQDVLSLDSISLGGSAAPPGALVLFPDKAFTLVFSVNNSSLATNSNITLVNNAREGVAGLSGGTGTVTLPDVTQSIAVAPDNSTAYSAVPNGTVGQNPPGAVEVLNLGAQSIAASIPVTGAQSVVLSPNGNLVVAFGSSPDTVTLISPALIGTNNDPRTFVTSSSFDHPVWAVFSPDGTSAYVLNCGAECGGTAASIVALDMTFNPPPIKWTLPVPAATFGLLAGSSLFVAGTQPPSTPGGNTCAGAVPATIATSCGELSVVNVNSNPGTIIGSALITDGYHNRMALGALGQLFIGSQNCTNITAQTPDNTNNEVRGCLSIYNATNSKVVVPPQNGDATGIAPITGRLAVYVCQGGTFQIYDTSTDQLQTQQLIDSFGNPISITGQALDVRLVD